MPKSSRILPRAVLALLIVLLIPRGLDDQGIPADLFIDDGNRQVVLPKKINKVYATTETGLFLVYALNPEAVLGWNRGLNPELAFAVAPQYHDLPTVGTWSKEYQTAQLDLLQKLEPDLIIHYVKPNEENILLAEEISRKLGKPAIVIDNSLKELPRALQTIGNILGKEIRGQALASYVVNNLNQAESFQKTLKNYVPVPVHIVSNYPTGYFAELLTLAGMVEMASWTNEPPFPDFVLIMPHSFLDPYRVIEKDGHKRIFQIPTFPANWLEPGSIFGLLGLQWLHSLAYPNTYVADLKEAYTMFMEIFFQLNITPELLSFTLQRSGIYY